METPKKEVQLTPEQKRELDKYLLEGYYWDKYIESYREFDR